MKKKRANGEGSIRRKPSGTWEGRYTQGIDPVTGKAIQKSVSAKTQAEFRANFSAMTISRRKQWRSLNAAAITSARSAGSFRENDGAFLNRIFAAEGVPNRKNPAVTGFFKAFLLVNQGNGPKILSELYNYEKEN